MISRRWKKRKQVQNLALLICDEAHLVNADIGPVYEVVISRTRYVSKQTEVETRIVALSASLANARDFGEWMGAPSRAIYNFPPRYVGSLSSLLVSYRYLVHARSIWIFTFRASLSPISHP